MFYGSRFYDPLLSRWAQPDSIIPQNQGTQAWDRYAYVNNNPVRYNDPSGHCTDLSECITNVLVNAIITLISPIFVLSNPFGGYRDDYLNINIADGGTPNVTAWMVDTMNANANGPIVSTLHDANSQGIPGKIAALEGWTAMVGPGSPWDYKVDFNVKNVKNVWIGSQQFSMETVANVMFGYVGMASGFSETELLVGAGIAQAGFDLYTGNGIAWENGAYFFDQPYDQWSIQFGILLYKELDGEPVTLEALKNAVLNYGGLLHPTQQKVQMQ